MILFFKGSGNIYFVVGTSHMPSSKDVQKLVWLFGEADFIDSQALSGFFIGPRKEMITPWSTNAMEITQNMGIDGIERIEEFSQVEN